MTPADRIVTTREAAKEVGRGESTIRRWFRQGLLEPVDVVTKHDRHPFGPGNGMRFKLSDVRAAAKVMHDRPGAVLDRLRRNRGAA